MNELQSRRISTRSASVLAGIIFMALSIPAWAWVPTLPAGVQGPASWYQNGQGGRYFVPVVRGKLSKPITGIVKTDSNCMPDAQGLSHCYNEIQLSSGKLITIQNTHKMSRYRCLRPGEYVQLQPNGVASWAIVQTEFGS